MPTWAWFKRPLPAALILVLLWTLWRLAFLMHTGIPLPSAHDEFSYLLGADTFVHGRLANPPHALSKFFESPHILVRPVYASKYPPGQSLFLATGQRLFGSPIYGVTIGNALMLFTFCLMLFAWVPYPWALALSVTAGLCLNPSMYWTNSYWGGSVAASGGALVLLGVGIYRKSQAPYAGAIFALGALLLFWTRPFEGGVFTLIVLAVFAKELWRKRRTSVFVAALLVLAAGGAWTCYDNQAITGNPFRLPYQLYESQYSVTPVFWFLPLRAEPAYSHPRLAALWGTNGWAASGYFARRPRWLVLLIGLFFSILEVRPLGAGALLTMLIPVAWRDPLYRKMAIVSGVVFLALIVETYHQEHYAAPAWAAFALMIAVWAEHAWRLKIRSRPVGPLLLALPFTAMMLFVPGFDVPTWPKERAALIDRLSALDRGQLVFVRYPSPKWRVEEEWVYNSSDIDGQRVIFAHDLGMEQNRDLLAYYPDRRALLLTFDSVSGQEQIEPYPSGPKGRPDVNPSGG
jgi:hypothetical protein